MTSPIKKAICASALGEIDMRSGGGLIRRFRFQDDFIGFSGHFPENPILPAVIQVIAAQTVIEEATKKTRHLSGIDNAKFLEPILPGVAIEITCLPLENSIENAKQAVCRVHLVESGKKAAGFTLCLSPTEKESMGS